MFVAISSIALAGVLGGLVAALIPGGRTPKGDLKRVGAPYQPGLVASAIVGGFAALVAWGLGEDVAGLEIFGSDVAASTKTVAITVGDVVAAMGTGLAGFKWLGNHWDAKLNQFIALQAAATPPNEELKDALASDDRKAAILALREARGE